MDDKLTKTSWWERSEYTTLEDKNIQLLKMLWKKSMIQQSKLQNLEH